MSGVERHLKQLHVKRKHQSIDSIYKRNDIIRTSKSLNSTYMSISSNSIQTCIRRNILLHVVSSPGFRVQREQIMAKQQEMENARLKNSGRAPKGSKDGLRPESPHSRRPRRPPVRKMVQPGRPKFEVNDKYKWLLLSPQQTFRHYYARKGKVCCCCFFSHVFEPNSTKHARTVTRVLCRRSAVNIGNNMILSAIWC